MEILQGFCTNSAENFKKKTSNFANKKLANFVSKLRTTNHARFDHRWLAEAHEEPLDSVKKLLELFLREFCMEETLHAEKISPWSGSFLYDARARIKSAKNLKKVLILV